MGYIVPDFVDATTKRRDLNEIRACTDDTYYFHSGDYTISGRYKSKKEYSPVRNSN